MNNAIKRQINQIYKEVFKKVFDNKTITELMRNDRSGATLKISSLTSSKKYEEFAQKFAIELAKKGLRGEKGVWRKFYEAAKAAHYVGLPTTFNEFEMNVYKKAIIHNFNMIKSIPTEMLEILNHKYMSTLIEEVAKGKLPRGTFKAQLQLHGNKKAELIARTETAKLQTTIIQNRSIDLGSKAYIWIASMDRRTRPSHRAMDDVVVFWSKSDTTKPLLDGMYGEAGEFPNCRCTPQPIFDEDDLPKSNYKVYNGKTHSIVNMTKKQLIELIEKGGF